MLEKVYYITDGYQKLVVRGVPAKKRLISNGNFRSYVGGSNISKSKCFKEEAP